MTILDTIVQYKKTEIEKNKALFPIHKLEKSAYFNRETLSFKKHIKNSSKNGIIAEFKRKSPSKGNINTTAKVDIVTNGYQKNGASALSILTDTNFFGGTNNDLSLARKINKIPILRKDFILSEYQVIEAKSIGADAILLIASILNPKEIKQLSRLAHQLGLEVLFEIHNKTELDTYIPEIDLVGINNRDLKTFKVDFNNAINLANQLPKQTVKIAESGIQSNNDIKILKENGFDGFLIGELFMKNNQPEKALKNFINNIPANEK